MANAVLMPAFLTTWHASRTWLSSCRARAEQLGVELAQDALAAAVNPGGVLDSAEGKRGLYTRLPGWSASSALSGEPPYPQPPAQGVSRLGGPAMRTAPTPPAGDQRQHSFCGGVATGCAVDGWQSCCCLFAPAWTAATSFRRSSATRSTILRASCRASCAA